MDTAALRAFLEDLGEIGRRHDAEETEHSRRFLNITPETGQFLAILVGAMRAARILEIVGNGQAVSYKRP